jgi:tetratricopeptide (TPR) repeat protein
MTMLLETPPSEEEVVCDTRPGKGPQPASFNVRDLCFALVCTTCVVYWNSFSGQFVFDDILQITDNPNVRQLWPLADWQRPLGYFTFQLNYALSGLQPWGYHLLNLFIHLANGLLLFDLSRRCIERVASDQQLRARAKYVAFAIAVLWLVHPLTTTAVTYTVQRLESLMALCFLGCLYALLRSADSLQPRWWQLAAIAAMVLGVLTKEVMITCLPVAMLFDRAFVARSWWGVWDRRAFYSLLALPLAWTFITMRMTNAEEYAAGFGFRGVTPWEYLRSQPQVLLHYLRLTFWPDQLLLDYGWPVANDPLSIYLPGLVIVTLVGLSLFALWKCPPVGCVSLSAFLVLGPSSSIMPIADLCFEHRMYLPLMGVIVLAVLAANRLIASQVKRQQQVAIAGGCLLLVTAGLGYRTTLRNADYANPIVLWERNVAARPAHARPHLLLAMLYDRAGRMTDAGAQYQAAVAAKPTYMKGLLNLGGWYFRQGEFSQAADCFARAVEVEPENPAGYVQRGRALLELGDSVQALPLLESGLQLEPSNTAALRALAWLLSTAKESELRDGSRALQLLKQLPPDPQQQDVWRLDVLAAALAETGDFVDAEKMIKIACLRAAEQNRPEALQQQLRERASCYERGEAWRRK